MNKKAIKVIFFGHLGLSAGGHLGVDAAALAAADAGREAGLLGWLDAVVHGILLQPIAHWVLAAAEVAWWTWPGLVMVAGLLAVNSAVATAVIAAVVHGLRRRSRAVRNR
jgi:hypothetical protein